MSSPPISIGTTPSTPDRKIIAVDMDEVLADALTEHITRYNRDFPCGPHDQPLSLDQLHGRYIWDAVPPDRLAVLESYIVSDDFFRVLNVMPDAPQVLERLQARYDVYIATAAMEVPTSFTAKFQWLAEHFPSIPPSHIVFCGDKSILRADYLIDDNPRQLRRFRGEGILYSAPSNVGVTGFRRVANWQEIEELFLG